MAIMKTSVRCKIEPQHPEPQEPKSPPVPLESLEDIAWELWLLIDRAVANARGDTFCDKAVFDVIDQLLRSGVR